MRNITTDRKLAKSGRHDNITAKKVLRVGADIHDVLIFVHVGIIYQTDRSVKSTFFIYYLNLHKNILGRRNAFTDVVNFNSISLTISNCDFKTIFLKILCSLVYTAILPS